ncbi:hypothetical protein MATL_G00256700 [Megalops atlanticus]|uniref:TNFR-Cys domain-containing protein n=1 Tax=Megalops atlanticus TaxID=7932 RepID=A0A9D3PDT2_MEGAT|nr:hypothetical protein MATL_G00256700 [Megalops atlanticus]
MWVDITTSWIVRNWIRHFIVFLYVQVVFSRPSCNPQQYPKDRRCCSKCPPGTFAFVLCTGTSDTICRPCGSNEYQPDWNNETRCQTQKFCDKGRGFDPVRPENRTAAVPCRCLPGLQCSLVNCEFCERMKVCPPGYGLAVGETGRGSCAECRPGFFSNVSSATEPCRPWTDCKALGRAEKQPGTEKTDAVCGPHVPGSTTSWVVVGVLSVIVVISLVILLLFCCKDKLKSLSENVRACVQDLKSNTMCQEAAQQNGTLEIKSLIRQEGDLQESLNACGNSEKPAPGGDSEAPTGGCSCVLALKEPMEVGENEDCSQAVAPCSCRDGEGGGGRPLLEPAICGGCPEGGTELCGRSLQHGAPEAGEGRAGGDARAEADDRQGAPCCHSTDSTAKVPLSLASDGDQGLSLHLSTGDVSQGPEPECPGQTVAAGHVTGNGNTTFISNGQVMNFSGDVIVVYVSQNSQGDSGDLEEAFASPVQEETNKEGFEGVAKPKTSTALQEDTLMF